MGLFDKIGNAARSVLNDNRNFGTTFKRINDKTTYYGFVNRGVKNGDFFEGSYISIIDGKGIVYGSSQDDYEFNKTNIKSFEFTGNGRPISAAGGLIPSMRYIIEFTDGKKAQMDIIQYRIESFKLFIGEN